jgi:hypothetical protein
MVPVIAKTGSQAIGFAKNNIKPIIIGAGVLVSTYMLYKWLTKPRPTAQFDNSFPNPVISDLKAKEIANILYNAMKNPGTDEQAIYNALQGLSYNDFVKVSNAFGMKYYNKTLGVEDDSWFSGIFTEQLDLTAWLYQELSLSDLNKLHQIAPNILTFDNQAKPKTNLIF